MPKRPPDFPRSAWRAAQNLPETRELVQMTPNGQQGLAYELVLPKGWITVEKMRGGIAGPARPFPLGLFLSSQDPRAAAVSVVMMPVAIEVDLEDWMLHVSGRDGWEALTSELHDTPEGRIADLGAVKEDEGEEFVSRTMALADGGRVFAVTGFCRRQEWSRWKEELLLACASFRLLAPTRSARFEQLHSWEGGIPRFGVAAPSSWRFEEAPGSRPGSSGVDVRLEVDGQPASYLNVRGIPHDLGAAPAVEAVLDESVRLLAKAGFHATGDRVFPARDPLGTILAGYRGTAVLMGRLGSSEAECRLGVRSGPTLTLSFTLVSPTQAEEEVLWMRGKKAFGIARNHCWPGRAEIGLQDRIAADR